MSNKIVVVLGSNIHWAPYFYKYESIFLKKNINFDLILWNREGINENTIGNIISYNKKDKSCDRNFFKVLKFFAFARFTKKVIKNNKYEKIVFLGLHGCAPVLNVRYFSNNYKQKFWLDIRDYHYEWFKPYYNLEKKLISNSYKTVISSTGFKKFLPSFNYGIVHNIDSNIETIFKNFKKIPSEKIRISFIGNVRYYEENVKLLNLLKNDDRFVLQYFGANSNHLMDYCTKNNILNVEFYGRFPYEKTIDFYCKTDIINNIYGNDSMEVTTALSNKLYYAIRLNLPILVSSKTYMEEFCADYGFAFSFRNTKNFSDDLFDWYNNLKKDNKVYVKQNELWKKIKKEDCAFEEEFIEFLLK